MRIEEFITTIVLKRRENEKIETLCFIVCPFKLCKL